MISEANMPDCKSLEPTLQTVMIERPDVHDTPQHLCLDKGYSGAPSTNVAETAGYTVHVPDNTNARTKRRCQPGRRKARRWVVEVAHSWINHSRRLLVRWEKKDRNHSALLHFACAIICWHKCKV